MRKINQNPSVVKWAVISLWVLLTFMAYQKSQAPKEPRMNYRQAGNIAAQKRFERTKVIMPQIKKGDWPTAPTGKDELAKNFIASNYLIIFDGSFSMNQSKCSGPLRKIEAARIAVNSFIRSLGRESNVALAGFGLVPSGKRTYEHDFVSGGKEEIITLLDSVKPLGTTPLVGSLGLGFKMLLKQARRQGGYGQYHMVIITDGISTDGDPAPLVKKIVSHSAIRIHAIGFCLEGAHGLDVPGYSKYSTAGDPKALEAGLKGVLAESDSYEPGEFMK